MSWNTHTCVKTGDQIRSVFYNSKPMSTPGFENYTMVIEDDLIGGS